jgi:hypothetical protein
MALNFRYLIKEPHSMDNTMSGRIVVNDIQDPSNVGQLPPSTGKVNR